MSYIYIASPYTHKDPNVVEQRYLKVMEATAHFLNQGIHVYSPVVHCHELAHRHNLPKDFEFWQDYNFAMLVSAHELWVIMIDGWKESVGVQSELDYGLDYLIVKYIDPDTFEIVDSNVGSRL